MSARSERFTDTDYGTTPRTYHQPHLFASRPVPDDFNTVKKLLAEEHKANRLYYGVWLEAKEEYNRKKQLSPDYFQSTTPSECYIAVIAYTLDTELPVDGLWTPLYRDFNRKFRQLNDEAAWDAFPYKSFYYLLTMALSGVKNKPDINSPLYRGIRKFHFSSPPKTGNLFYFDYFASCSTSQHVAEMFMGANGTMVELRDGAKVAMGISEYSPFDEEEVLVFPRSEFIVFKFERRESQDKLVLGRLDVVHTFKSAFPPNS